MKPFVIGIAGGSGSGKSTVARRVTEALHADSAAFIDMDGYYNDYSHLPFEERRRINWDHPEAFDIELLTAQLDALTRGQPVAKPIYDFVNHVRSPLVEQLEPAEVLVVDGILLFVDPRLRERCDIKVFVDADADIRLVRRIRRDVRERGRGIDEILEQYLATVQPMHQQFVEPSKRYADVIIPQGGHNVIAIDMIVADVRRRLARTLA